MSLPPAAAAAAALFLPPPPPLRPLLHVAVMPASSLQRLNGGHAPLMLAASLTASPAASLPAAPAPRRKAQIKTQIEDGRWFFLVVCILQARAAC